MGTLRFETPEDVDLEFRLAGPGSRFVAWAVDMLMLWSLLAGIGMLILVLVAGLGIAPDSAGFLIGALVVAWGFAPFLYFTLFEIARAGATPGKRGQGLIVVLDGGYALTPGAAVVRNLFRPLDQIPLLWVIPLLDPHRRRLGDFVAGTLVVRAARAAVPGTPLAELEAEAVPRHLQLTRRELEALGARELDALEEFFRRADALPADARKRIESTLAGSLLAQLDRPRPEGAADGDLLREIYLALRERLE